MILSNLHSLMLVRGIRNKDVSEHTGAVGRAVCGWRYKRNLPLDKYLIKLLDLIPDLEVEIEGKIFKLVKKED